MFYATKIKSVHGGCAIDVYGKYLRFIGYLPVEEGDIVYTDGNVIFGNAPPRGRAIITHSDLAAIPFVGLTSSAFNVAGYFLKDPSYKSYPVFSKDDWIVNDENIFKHGNDIDDKKVIDAEIADDGGLFVVSDGEFRDCQTVSFYNHLFKVMVYRKFDDQFYETGTIPYTVLASIDTFTGSEITLGVDNVSVNSPVTVYKNDVAIEEIDLSPFALLAKNNALAARDRIMNRSADISGAANLIRQPNPPSSFVASNCVYPLTFRVQPSGDWDAIFVAGAYGYCFPYTVYDCSVFELAFNESIGGSKDFSEKLIDCLSDLERSIFTDQNFPFLDIQQYPPFSGTKKQGGSYTAEYINYIESKLQYYIPRVKFKAYEWHVVAFGSSLLLHVHNGDIVSTMLSRSFVGNDVHDSFRSWDEENFLSDNSWLDNFVLPIPDEVNSWQFPLDDSTYLVGEGASITSIFDESSNTTVDTYDISGMLFWKITAGEGNFYYVDDETTDPEAQLIANQILGGHSEAIMHKRYCLPKPYYSLFSTTGKSRGGIFNTAYDQYSSRHPDIDQTKIKYFSFMDFWLDSNFLNNSELDGLFRFNPLFAKLSSTYRPYGTSKSSNYYLFGAHDNALYTQDPSSGDDWKFVIYNGMKNFRLRKLKKIQLAKT